MGLLGLGRCGAIGRSAQHMDLERDLGRYQFSTSDNLFSFGHA